MDVFILSESSDAKCELCGKMDELRPYGPNGENICFDCGMKNKETTKKQFLGRLRGDIPDERRIYSPD
jgi:hypothetical protein